MIPPRTILAAIDFSDASTTALVFAARLARHCQARLHVLHVPSGRLGVDFGFRGDRHKGVQSTGGEGFAPSRRPEPTS